MVKISRERVRVLLPSFNDTGTITGTSMIALREGGCRTTLLTRRPARRCGKADSGPLATLRHQKQLWLPMLD